MKYIFRVLILLLLPSMLQAQKLSPALKQKAIEEIRAVEKSFEFYLNRNGAAAAFHHFAAPEAVLKRSEDRLIKGRTAIYQYYANKLYKDAQATWNPEVIDISDDGTMAYTYGRYEWKLATGKTFEGVFHTVWKKMNDGSWKYVWD